MLMRNSALVFERLIRSTRRSIASTGATTPTVIAKNVISSNGTGGSVDHKVLVLLGLREPPYDLVVKLLYGCGLRLFECLKLRVQNFDCDEGVLTVMDGKGKKARTVSIPQSISTHGVSSKTLKETTSPLDF